MARLVGDGMYYVSVDLVVEPAYQKIESAEYENRTSGAVRGRELVTPSYSIFYIFMLRIEVESVRINKVYKQGIARIKGFLLS